MFFNSPPPVMTHKNPNSPTSLTEFAPHSADVRQSTGLLSRIFRRNGEPSRDDGEQSLNGDNLTAEDVEDVDRNLPGDSVGESMGSRSESVSSVVAPSGIAPEPSARTLPSVLKRLRRIIAGSGQTLQAYKDSDFKQYWMPDSNCHQCYECNSRFHAFRRRHHCRICGQIFCSQCCNKEVPGKIMGFTGSLRVCTYCCEVVLHYVDNLDGTADDIEDVASVPDSQRVVVRESSESPARAIMGQTDNVASGNLSFTASQRSLHAHRLSSIFDEDLKRSRSASDLDASLSNLNGEHRPAKLQDSSQLQNLWLMMTNPTEGIGTQTHRYRLRSYPNCMLGRHIVDWLIDKCIATTREQATSLGQVLLDTKWLESTSINDPIFRDDFTSYRPSEMALRDGVPDLRLSSATESDGDDEPQWFKEIKQQDKDEQISGELIKIPSTVSAHRDNGFDPASNSVFFVDALQPCDSSAAHCLDTSPIVMPTAIENSVDSKSGTTLESGTSFNLSGGFQSNSERIPLDNPGVGEQGESDHSSEVHNGDSVSSHYRTQLSKIQKEHLTMLVMQMLHRSGLSTKWADTILATAQKVGQTVRPDARLQRDANELDIRQFVRIKKVPGGTKSNTCIISGVVCTKNVAHKKMRQQLTNPRVLLLRAPIEYQRVENKFSSLEPQILQENEFLKNCVSRIAKLQPDILLVEKTVSRLAQGFLLDAGITLVLNVKASVMERVARMTQAVIATSIDGLVAKTTMGSCRSFYLQTFTLLDGVLKTLMYFDGCDGHLGCTVTLRGGSFRELQRVKQLLSFMIYASYHSGLELEFLMNELAIPPQLESRSDRLENSVTLDSTDDSSSSQLQKPDSNELAEVGLDDAGGSMFPDQGGPDSVFIDDKDELETLDTSTDQEDSKPEVQNSVVASRKETLTSELITDLSDPLHSYQMLKDETIFDRSSTLYLKEDERHMPQHRQFKKALKEVLLTISPCVKFDVPYLETEAGSKCKLRSCFPSELYWSEVFHPEIASQLASRRKLSEVEPVVVVPNDSLSRIELLPKHSFVTDRLSSPVNDLRIQAELADFRARGGRIPFELVQNGFATKNNAMTSSSTSGQGRSQQTSNDKDSDLLPRLDCFEPSHHQRICLLFSSYSPQSVNSPNPCVLPWTVTMNFYSRTDITLGGFLDKYCFSESYRCVSRACETPMVEHIRRFVHGNACIHVVLKKLDAQLFYPAEAIYVWNWCRKCKRVSPKILLSPEAYQMSFAKFLELRFHGNSYLRRSNGACRHSLHLDHIQYFGNQQIIASFKYSTITLKEVSFPPIVISILPPEFCLQQLEDDGQMINYRTSHVFVLILEQLHRLKKDASTESQSSYITELVMEVEKEKDSIIQKIEYVQSLIKDAKRQQANSDLGIQVQDAFVEIKHQVAEIVTAWNERIHETEQQQRKADKTRPQSSVSVSSNTAGKQTPKDAANGTSATVVTDHYLLKIDDGALVVTMNPPTDEEKDDNAELKSGITGADSAVPGSASSNMATTSPQPPSVASSESANTSTSDSTPSSTVTPMSGSGMGHQHPSSDSLSSSFGKTSAGYDLKVSSDSSSSSPPKFTAAEAANPMSSSQTSSVLSQLRSRSSSDLRKIKGLSKDGTLPDVDRRDRTMAVKNIFSSLLSFTGNTTVPIPFPSDEHHLLSMSCQKVAVVVYDQEPSSIIAFALSSQGYEKQLQELKANQVAPVNETSGVKKGARLGDGLTDADVKRGVVSFLKAGASREKSPNRPVGKFQVEAVAYNANSDRDSLDDTDEVDGFQVVNDVSQKSTNKANKQQPQNFHIELQFYDCNANFYCRVSYAEQFAKLRKLIFPEGEERYIRSLSRCFTWHARGGKSGSSFCKTQDDRFILKQMSKIEVQNFNEFAPHYFQYITKAYEAGKPTSMAKILGVYRIGYQNSKTTNAMKQDLLVMENLFYGRKISQIFDLKGSARNRLVDTSGKRVEDVVLLDENLVKTSVESPMYVYSHSKAVLMASISQDTEFLAKNYVMDYSLLVGVDETEKQFIVGIIDYIRTFTWDKKVEMIIKTATGNVAPTVVSPEAYKRRFLDAMDRYFLLVPDRWYGLGQGID